MTIWLELGSLGLEAIDPVEDVGESSTKSVSDIEATPAIRAVVTLAEGEAKVAHS